MSESRRFLKELIRWVLVGGARWSQDAKIRGEAICAGCNLFAPIVYSNGLQWCEGCWPLGADLTPDTQSKAWKARRRGQERDYEWVA